MLWSHNKVVHTKKCCLKEVKLKLKTLKVTPHVVWRPFSLCVLLLCDAASVERCLSLFADEHKAHQWMCEGNGSNLPCRHPTGAVNKKCVQPDL